MQEAFLKEYPLGRIGTAEDIANAALWLACDESFVTGQVLQINGGLTLRRNPTPREINASIKRPPPPLRLTKKTVRTDCFLTQRC